jgi:hypothetical protein
VTISHPGRGIYQVQRLVAKDIDKVNNLVKEVADQFEGTPLPDTQQVWDE